MFDTNTIKFVTRIFSEPPLCYRYNGGFVKLSTGKVRWWKSALIKTNK